MVELAANPRTKSPSKKLADRRQYFRPDGCDQASAVNKHTEIESQWGAQVTPFGERSAEYKSEILQAAKKLRDLFSTEFGIELFVCYGVLLGFTRSGDFVGHDFDLDFAYISGHENKADVVAESARVIEKLADLGFQIKEASFGQYKVWKDEVGDSFRFEIFVGWREGENAFLYFGIDQPVSVDLFFPLRERDFGGVTLPIPNQPEAVCETIYGKNWRTPDTSFRYALTPQQWKRFSFLFTSQNRDHWNAYYKHRSKIEPWSILPSQFAAFVANEVPPGRLLEIGCGNGRDSIFFSSVGFAVTATDYSSTALDLCRARSDSSGHGLRLAALNLYDLSQVKRFLSQLDTGFAVIYARFFLHAISEIGERNFGRLCIGALDKNGKCFVEFRTDRDKRAEVGFKLSDNETIDGHYRRFISLEKIMARAERFGLKISFATSGTGMAAFRGDDPHVGRLVLEKSDAPRQRSARQNRQKSLSEAP
jgi:SAM-dependent methyltransferase